MRKRSKVLVTLSVILFFSFLVIFASRALDAKSPVVHEEAKLTFEAQALKSEHQKLEPIQFEFKAINKTSEPITWSAIFGIGPSVNLFVRKNGGAEVLWEGRTLATVLVGQVPNRMMPGNEYANKSLLPMDLAAKIFPDSGVYDVRFELVYSNYTPEMRQVKVLSNPVKIVIAEPLGVDREAYRFVTETLLSRQRKSDAEITQLKQTFVDRFPNSIYARYLIYELALVYFHQDQDQKALRELCKVSNANFYFSEQVKVKIDEIDRKLHPEILVPNLAEDAPVPIRPDPCLWVQN